MSRSEWVGGWVGGVEWRVSGWVGWGGCHRVSGSVGGWVGVGWMSRSEWVGGWGGVEGEWVGGVGWMSQSE